MALAAMVPQSAHTKPPSMPNIFAGLRATALTQENAQDFQWQLKYCPGISLLPEVLSCTEGLKAIGATAVDAACIANCADNKKHNIADLTAMLKNHEGLAAIKATTNDIIILLEEGLDLKLFANLLNQHKEPEMAEKLRFLIDHLDRKSVV